MPHASPADFDIRRNDNGKYSVDRRRGKVWTFMGQFSSRRAAQQYIDAQTKTSEPEQLALFSKKGQADNVGMDSQTHSPIEISETNISPEQAEDALKTFAGTDLLNLETGITARINSEQRNKIISKKALNKSLHNGFTAVQHNATAAKIDKVFKYASLVETGKDKSGDVNIASIKRFASPVVFGDETATAYLTLKESLEHGHRIYSLELETVHTIAKKDTTVV